MRRAAKIPAANIPSAKRGARAYRAALAGVAIMALAVRVYHLDVEDFWQDEIHSMYNSAGARAPAERIPHGVILRDLPRYSDLTPQSTLPGVWRTMDDDSHPPVYFMLLLLWRKCVGDGEAWIRLMPVVFSVLSIFPVMGLLRELGDRRAAVISGIMLVLCFCHINMAQENRPYSLSGLLVNLSFYLLVRMEKRWGGWSSRQRWILATLYGTVLFVAMMNHYFAGFAFVGQLVYVVIRWRGPMLRAWLVSTALAATVFCVVWGPHLWGQRDFIRSQDWLLENEADHTQRTVLRVADLPIRFLFRVSRFKLDAVNAVLGATLLTTAGLCCWKWGRSRSLLFACWYLLPVALFAAIDLGAQRQHLTHFRYAFIALPALCALLATAMTKMGRVAETTGMFAFILACIPTISGLPAQDNPHARSAVRLIEADLGPSDLVIFDAVDWPSFWALRMYQMISFYLPKPNPPMLLLRESPDPALVEQIRSFEHLYVVSPRPEVVPNPTPETHPFVEHSVYFKEIGWVYRCSRRPST